ncbi:hypothetical protein HJFPF1_02794 [Paramyrothecium foliicola]|nr:hypothetical protein HJFPF1_02794 [Paramyrothecium foliicola]
MAPQVHIPDMSPNTTTGAETGYFATQSKDSTPGTTPASTPGPQSMDFAEAFASKTPTNPLPALSRDFPRPVQEVDVKTALERQPGRWTIKGQMEANLRRSQQNADDEAEKEKRAREFEAAKRELLASHDSLRTQFPAQST